jgi:hypothetical protein
MSVDQFDQWKKGDPIGYLQQEIPSFELPPNAGTRYDAMVPDTLDLQERASLAVNGLTGPTDPDADYEIYWKVHFNHNPPMMQHDGNDHVQVKFLEALPLMRLISGSDLNRQVEQRWMEVLLQMQGADGSLYYPVKGRPWCSIDTYGGPPETDHYMRPYDDGRMLGAIAIYHHLTGDPLWLETGKRVVQGLAGRAIDRGDYAYFAQVRYDLGKEHDRSAPMLDGGGASCAGWALHGLSQFFRMTGYKPAGELATKLAYGLRDHANWYKPDGTWLLEDSGHFHHHTLPLLAIADHAMATGDQELLAFAERGYLFGREWGHPVLGFFPEAIVTDYRYKDQWGNTSELCEVADMIALGLKLSRSGIGDYWDDVDRWTRNQFAEGQLCQCDWIDRVSEHLSHSAVDDRYQAAERVAERNLGAFATFPWPNDWYRPDWGWGISHCCTGNGTRALYYVWQNILTHDEGNLRVNLLMNRASPWADVNSHIPYTGRVDVQIKTPVVLSVRIPEWTEPENLEVTVNEAARTVRADGRYVEVGAMQPNDTVTLCFPLAERTDELFIEKRRYQVVRRGNDVVCIDPPGQVHPLYQRAHYRQDNTRWHEISRFISDQSIDW